MSPPDKTTDINWVLLFLCWSIFKGLQSEHSNTGPESAPAE